MSIQSRCHLSDPALLRTLTEDLARENGVSAQVLADLAEVDARRLYLPAGFPSMFEFCLRELRFSREKAYKRIRAARTARRFPAIFELVGSGRLSHCAVVMLAAHLTGDNAGALLAAAADRTLEEIERMLVARFPRPDMPERIVPLSSGPTAIVGAAPFEAAAAVAPTSIAPAPGLAVAACPGAAARPAGPISGNSLSVRTVENGTAEPSDAKPIATAVELSVRTVEAPAPRPRVTPLAPERFAIQCTVNRRTHDHLRRAQELLRHQLPDGSVAGVLERALELLVRTLEKRKLAATDRPRAAKPGTGTNSRAIPAAVKRAVWKRDRGQCTFRSGNGRRCEARGHLEFDHELPVARGGRSTAGNLRLRCRAHNQYEAERTYGAEFMSFKREAARERRARRGIAAERDSAPGRAPC